VWIVACNVENSIISGNGRRDNGSARRSECSLQTTGSDCHAPDTEGSGQLRKTEYENDAKDSDRGWGCDFANKDINNWDTPWLEAATRLCTLDDGLPGGLVRPKGWRVNALKAAGNAVLPQIPYILMRCILEVENGDQ
jgi:hypothetical protein